VILRGYVYKKGFSIKREMVSKKRKQKLDRNIWLMNVIRFLRSFMFFVPIFALYLQEQLFTVLNVTIIMAIITFVTAVLEVPSGVFTDFFGRRKTLILSCLIAVINVSLLATGTEFIHFVFYAIVSAFSRALNSGTDESLLYDTLKEFKEQGKFKKVIGAYHAIGPIAMSISSIIGGLLATISLRTPVYVTIIPFVIALIFSLFLVEPKYHKSISTVFGHVKKSTALLFSNRQLFLLSLASLLFFSFGESIHQISQIFYSFNNIPVAYFGFIFGAVFGLSSAGSFFSHSITEKFGNKRSLIFSTVFSMIVLIIATYVSGWLAVFFLIIGSFTYGIRNPVMSYMTNLEVASSNRATVLSIRNFAQSVGFTIFAPILGILTDSIGILGSYRLFGGGFLILIFIQSLLKEKN